jgi:hypothetical protein
MTARTRDCECCAEDANSELPLQRQQQIPPLCYGMTNKKANGFNREGLGELLLFKGEGEFFPLGEEGGALRAEGFEFGGVFLGLVGGGEVA